MKILVLGATGRTGRLVVGEGLRRGHDVVALVRDPTAAGFSERVAHVEGDVRDQDAVRAALAGVDCVVSALGPRRGDRSLHRDAARTVIAGMLGAGVRRYVGVSGAGVTVPGDRKSPRDRVISWGMRRFAGGMVVDKAEEYSAWSATDLDWTLVRPPRLGDGTGAIPVEHDAHRSPRSTVINRSDLARFLVDLAESDRYLRQAPLVANR